MSNDFLFGDKTLTFIFMYKYNNIRLIYVNYKSLNNTLKSALVNQLEKPLPKHRMLSDSSVKFRNDYFIRRSIVQPIILSPILFIDKQFLNFDAKCRIIHKYPAVCFYKVLIQASIIGEIYS